MPGLGAGAPGAAPRAAPGTAGRRRATAADGRAAALHLPATLLAAAPHQRARGRTRRPAAAAAGRPARGRARGPRGQPGAVRASTRRLDGRAAPDGARSRAPCCRCCSTPTSAATRSALVTFRGTGRRAWCCRRLVGRGRGAPAGAAAHRRPDPAGRGLLRGRATCCACERLRDPRAGRCWSWSPTAGPPAGPDPLARARRAAALLAAEGAAAVVVDCESGPVRLGSGRASWPRTSAPSTCRWPSSRADGARPAASAARRPRRDEGGRPDAAGKPRSRPRRRADHPAAPQPAAARRAHRRRQGQVDRRVRDGAAGLEPGLADRGVPVREERQVEGRRGDRASRARPAARARPARAARSSGTRWARAGRGSRKPGTEDDHAADGRRGLGRDQAPARRADATASTCWTSSPTR